MSIKRQVINESLKRIESRLSKIDRILDADPLGRICEIKSEAHDILVKHKGDYKKIRQLMEPLAKEEKKMFGLYEKSKDSLKLIEEKVELESERYQLMNDRYFMYNR